MTPWQNWLGAWKGASSFELGTPFSIPSSGPDLLALGLFAGGLSDAATLRQARLLSQGNTDLQTLLLLLLVRLRQGQPRSSLESLLELVAPLTAAPEYGWDSLDLPALRQAQEERFPHLVRELARFSENLSGSKVVGTRGQDPSPLVLSERLGDTLWFGFACFEAATDRLLERLEKLRADSPVQIDEEVVQAALRSVDPDNSLHQGQREAVERSLRERLVILVGGPGTGKTTVVARILAAQLEVDPALGAQDVVLCAPTGRAQARLSESVRQNLEILGSEGEASRRREELQLVRSATLHSLLGARPDGTFRHHAAHPLPYRLVVVDESSMIDLPLFSALLDALAPRTRLVLVGDPDQLPSVEAGAVLSDLVANPVYAPNRSALTKVWRSTGAISGIASGLREGRWDGALVPRVSLREWATSAFPPGAVLHLEGELQTLLRIWVDRWLGGVTNCRILCATHGGESGREAVNRLCDAFLRERIGGRGRFLPRQPVILGRNHPELDLWNGDLGVVLEQGGESWVDFDGVHVRARQLDGLESAWAVTVHKSQGSEFEQVLFILPERDTPLLTRQISYTALTRAKSAAYLWGDANLLSIAAARREERPSRVRG